MLAQAQEAQQAPSQASPVLEGSASDNGGVGCDRAAGNCHRVGQQRFDFRTPGSKFRTCRPVGRSPRLPSDVSWGDYEPGIARVL